MRFGRFTWLHAPPETGPPKAGTLDQIKEVAFLQELFELGDTVASELLVLEIKCVPGPLVAVQNVDRTRFWVPGH